LVGIARKPSSRLDETSRSNQNGRGGRKSRSDKAGSVLKGHHPILQEKMPHVEERVMGEERVSAVPGGKG